MHVLRLHYLAGAGGKVGEPEGSDCTEAKPKDEAADMQERTERLLVMMERVQDRWPVELWPPQLREKYRKRVEARSRNTTCASSSGGG